MGFARGVKAIEEVVASGGGGDFARRLKIEDGDAYTVRIIEEGEQTSPFYDESRGLVGVILEHKSPKQEFWMRKAECTLNDEGRCWACEQFSLTGDKKWKPKKRFYMNLIVDNGKDEPYVAYWDTATYRSTVYDNIMEMLFDTGSISNMEWRLKRKGAGQNDTTYTFMPKAPDSKPFDFTGFEPYDLEKIVPTIPYEEQKAYFGYTDSVIAEEQDQPQDQPADPSGIEW